MSITRDTAELMAYVTECERRVTDVWRVSAESVWANVLTDTIYGSEWLKDKSVLPLPGDAGNPTIYALYRILNEAHPRYILQLGKPVVSGVLNQYARNVKDVVVSKRSSSNKLVYDLVCLDASSVVDSLANVQLSNRAVLVVSDEQRQLKSVDVEKFAGVIASTGRSAVVGRYEGIGMGYVITGKDMVYLVSM